MTPDQSAKPDAWVEQHMELVRRCEARWHDYCRLPVNTPAEEAAAEMHEKARAALLSHLLARPPAVQVQFGHSDELAWTCKNGSQHSMSLDSARAVLQELYEEWPGGLEEIEASVSGWRRRALASQSAGQGEPVAIEADCLEARRTEPGAAICDQCNHGMPERCRYVRNSLPPQECEAASLPPSSAEAMREAREALENFAPPAWAGAGCDLAVAAIAKLEAALKGEVL